MNRDKKTLALYAVFVIVALFSLYKVYSFLRSEKPAETQKAAESGAPGELAVDLNEKQVGAIKIGESARSPSFWSAKRSATSTSTRTC